MLLIINSSYGRAFKAIRENEIAAEAMGVNLFKHKELAFILSSFFTGIAGGLLAVFMRSIEAKTFQVSLTYNILLMVVIGGIGSITGSIIGAFLVNCGQEWLRFFDTPLTIAGVQIPLFRTGFRMVIFSILLMVVVLFYRKGIMGTSEFSWDGLGRLIRSIPGRFGKKQKVNAADMIPQEPVRQEEAAETAPLPVPQPGEPIPNPLPGPKKHVPREMDYAFEPDEQEMCFDIENLDEKDDFDLL